MKVDVTKLVVDYDGNPLTYKEGSDERPMTVGDVLLIAVNSPAQEEKVDAATSVALYKASLEVATAKGEVEISDLVRDTLEPRLAKIYTPIVAGQVILLLRG
jgi:hypothetical protein